MTKTVVNLKRAVFWFICVAVLLAGHTGQAKTIKERQEEVYQQNILKAKKAEEEAVAKAKKAAYELELQHQREVAKAKEDAETAAKAELKRQMEVAKAHDDALKAEEQKRQKQKAAEAELAAKQAQEQKIKAFEPNMVAIPAGSFLMGSPASEQGRDKDEPQHTVSVSAFYMGQTEVTKGQFGAFVAATNYLTEAEQGDGCYGWTGGEWAKDKKFNWQNAGFAQTDQHPVVCVSWNDALAYIAWLNKETGKNYRLPTEAEWEYAARAGTTTPFSFGDNITPEQVNYNGNYPYAGGAKGLYRAQTVPVKSLPPNPWGLYEMHGNVWEWCADWFGGYGTEAVVNPTGPEKGFGRLLRGGSLISNGWNTRSALRNRSVPANRDSSIGFRLALG